MTVTKSVKGILHDRTSGKPVTGATIMITGGSYEYPEIASQSDNEGVFYLPEIRIPGNYTLLIKHGVQSKTMNVQLNPGSILDINM